MPIIMIRTAILYIVVIALLRLMGKKQLGELQPSELVTTILISNIATLSIEDPTVPMMIGIVPVLMIVCIDVFMSVIMLKSPRFRRTVTGSPKIIISEGVIDRRELKKLRYTIDDVLEAMRGQGIFDISEVRYAIVETTGKINFFKKEDGDTDPPCVVVKDGMTEPDGMEASGLDAEGLKSLLRKNNAEKKDVFLMTLSRDGKCTIIKNEMPDKERNG